MRRLKYFWLFLILTLPLCFAGAQSTTVNGTIVDTLGNTWSYATITALFQEAPGVSGPYVWTGGTINRIPAAVTANSSGVFSISLPTNSGAITPSGSTWLLSVCPNASLQCAVVNVSLTGGTLNLIPVITGASAWPQLPIITLAVPLAYNINQVANPPARSGGLIYDTSVSCLKVYNAQTGWSCTGGGSSSGVNEIIPAGKIICTPFTGGNCTGNVTLTVLCPSDATCGGAKGDLQYSNACTILSSSHNLTCSTAIFTSGDIGKSIYVSGAGTSANTLLTTISGFTDNTHIVLTTAASTTSGTAHVAWGTDDTTALNNGYIAATIAQIPFYIPAGNYLHHGLNFTNSEVSVSGDAGDTKLYAFVGTTGNGVDISATDHNSFNNLSFYGGGLNGYWPDYTPRVNVLGARTAGNISIVHSFTNDTFWTYGPYNVVLDGFEQTDFIDTRFACYTVAAACSGNLYLSAVNTPAFTSAFVTPIGSTSMTKLSVSGAKTVFDPAGKQIVFDQGSTEGIYEISIRDAYANLTANAASPVFISDTGSGAIRQIDISNVYAETNGPNTYMVRLGAPAWNWHMKNVMEASNITINASPYIFSGGFLDSEAMIDTTGSTTGIELSATSCAGSYLHLGQQQPTTNCTDYASLNNVSGFTSGFQANGGDSPSYPLPGTGSGSTAWVKLGTWVANSVGDALRLSYVSMNGFSSGGGQQQWGEITTSLGQNIAAPNITGITETTFNAGNTAFPALLIAATGGSTSVSNNSWDVWVQSLGFAFGSYKAYVSPSGKWTPVGTVGTPPSGSYVVNGVVNPVCPLTLTTTGSSGASTFTPATCVLNIPSYSGGGGAGTVTHTPGPLTLHDCVVGNAGADETVDPDCTLDGAGNLTVTSVETTDTASVGGGWMHTEGPAPSGVTGKELIWADSTAHWYMFNPNNTSAYAMAGIATPGTPNNCWKVGTTGYDLVDAGAPCGGSSGIANVSVSVGSVTLAAQLCDASATTFSMPGVVTGTPGSIITFGDSSDPTAINGYGNVGGMVIKAWPSAANVGSYKRCNQTTGSLSAGAVVFNVSAK